MLKNLVHNWLLGGADLEVGLRLFMEYTKPSHAVSRIITKKPQQHIQSIKIALLRTSGLPFDFKLNIESLKKNKGTDQSKQSNYRLRNQWPFLADADCPPELKLLITDKITAFTKCAQEYDHLTNCTTIEEQLNTVSGLVDNFIINHEIYKELKHYADTGKVLGKHIIFSHFQRIKDLRNLNTMELFNKKKNLENAIWRNQSKIKKEKRPDLLPIRNEKIKALKMQLLEVNRLIE